MPQRRMESPFREDIDATPKQVLQVEEQSPQRESADAGRNRHKEVNVAFIAGIPARHRSEHAHVRDAATGG
jgi:hypothetical protein